MKVRNTVLSLVAQLVEVELLVAMFTPLTVGTVPSNLIVPLLVAFVPSFVARSSKAIT